MFLNALLSSVRISKHFNTVEILQDGKTARKFIGCSEHEPSMGREEPCMQHRHRLCARRAGRVQYELFYIVDRSAERLADRPQVSTQAIHRMQCITKHGLHAAGCSTLGPNPLGPSNPSPQTQRNTS